MGYTTKFEGEIEIDPPLNLPEYAYLKKFQATRRMDRGKGPYFVDGSGFAGQGDDEDVRDYNSPDPSQPDLWCKWEPNDDGTAIRWSGAEKFYDPEEWMQYLIDHFLKPSGVASESGDPQFERFAFNHICNGVIYAQGEDPEDRWKLVVKNNEVSSVQALLVWEDEE